MILVLICAAITYVISWGVLISAFWRIPYFKDYAMSFALILATVPACIVIIVMTDGKI